MSIASLIPFTVYKCYPKNDQRFLDRFEVNPSSFSQITGIIKKIVIHFKFDIIGKSSRSKDFVNR